MKILLDPILTAKPSKCSTNIQFTTFVNKVLAERSDVFFYWRVPVWLTEEEFAWYPTHPNIEYLRVEQHSNDRVQEMFHMSRGLEEQLQFFGPFWDIDVVITVRTTLVPLMKLLMASPRTNMCNWTKEIWLLEEMPMFAFKGTVPVVNEEVQENMTLQGYIAADSVFLFSYHEKKGIVEAARRYLSVSSVVKVQEKLRSVVAMQDIKIGLKSKDFFRPYEEKPFGLAFTGRMNKDAGIELINKVMTNSKILKGDKIKSLACTPSRVIKTFDSEIVEINQPEREEFWSIMREEVNVFMNFSTDMGISLSLLEPVLQGTPAILVKEPWAVGMFGEDYPFYVDSETKAAGMLEWMYLNYPTAYAKFAKWHKESLIPLYEERLKTDYLYGVLLEKVDRFATDLPVKYRKQFPNKGSNSILQLIASKVENRDEFVLTDVIQELSHDGQLDSLAKKLRPEFIKVSSLPWLPSWNDLRLALKYVFDWEDASTKVGHMKRSKK